MQLLHMHVCLLHFDVQLVYLLARHISVLQHARLSIVCCVAGLLIVIREGRNSGN